MKIKIYKKIYLPYPVEFLVRLVSWLAVIIIDLLELIFIPFMHAGIKSFGAFSVIAALFSGYAAFRYDLIIQQAFALFGALNAVFIGAIVLIRLISFIMRKLRQPFADVIFAPVCLSVLVPNSTCKR